MSTSCCALALALLTGPPGSPISNVTPEEWPAVRAAIIGITVEWEILDEREERLARFEEFASDVDTLRRRRRELANAPKVQDAERFPKKAVVEERLSFNRAYRRYLEQWRKLEPGRAAELDAVIQETDHLYQIWDAVRDFRSEAYYLPVRRMAMRRLREQIGDAAYFSASLPPHVPVWRFTEVK